MILKDKVAVVTGGVSGLGAAVVAYFLAQQARVVIFDVAPFESDSNERISYYKVDVRDELQVRQAMDSVVAELGALHICVNCAGIAPAKKILDRESRAMPLSDFKQVIDINLVGTFAVGAVAAEKMALNDAESGERGVIVNTASIAAYEGQKGQCAYAASKGAIASLTLPMARDLASQGIRVVGIAPGVMATPLMQAMPESVQDGLSASIPFPKRMGRVEEFASLVGHIVSNTYINAEVIRLDGALRMA